jgi:hypothetical protein
VDSRAGLAQTGICSVGGFGFALKTTNRARPGGATRESMNTAESMNAAPSPESRAGTDVQVYQRTQPPNLTPLSPFSTAGMRNTWRTAPEGPRHPEKGPHARPTKTYTHTNLHTYKPTHIQTYRRFPQRTSILSDLHTFTPSYRVKPKIGTRERERGARSFMSHFLTRQKTRRKNHHECYFAPLRSATRLSALRRAALLGRGTT